MLRKSVALLALSLALSVCVVAQNQPQCTLKVAPGRGPAPLNVTANVNCTDPVFPIVQVSLDWGDGSAPFVTTTQTSFQQPHTYSAAGTFTAVVTATDLATQTFSASQIVTVTAANQPPTCTLDVSPASGTVPLTVTATGSCSDPENDISSEVLDWGDHTSTPGISGTHTYTTRGKFTVKLTATDSGGLTGSATSTVTVTRNQTPTCALAVVPTSGPAPLIVSASATCSDSDGDTLTIVLAWGDGSTSAGSTGNHTYTAAGHYTVTATATDPAGNKGTASQPVSVTTLPPNSTPSCTLQVSPTSGTAPLAVAATAKCSDAGNDLGSEVISFGDGFYAAGLSSSHTYTRGGSYTVSVVASDKAGNSSQPATQGVTVNGNPALFVGVSGGQVAQFTKSGNKQASLNSNQGGSMTGMAFDAAGNLYTTDFTADTVTQFSGNGTLQGSFGSGYNCKPESIVFDNAGNAYVGETGCSHALLKFDAYGTLEAAYSVATEQEGSDWIDLASDQCTIFYTSQGASVLRYNACTRQQLAPFASGLNTGLAVKILPDGGVLVADKQDVVRFDSAGRKIMTYTASGENCFVGLALDSDNASFWATDYCSSDVVRFDLGSGNEISKFNSGTAANTVYGIAERIAPAGVTPAGPLTAAPAQASVGAGQSASFTLNFVPAGAAAGKTFSLACADLPANSSCTFSPATVQAGNSPVSVQLSIGTTGSSALLAPPSKRSGWALALGLPWLGMTFILLGSRRKRLVVLLAVLVGLVALVSCSGASGNSSSPPPPSSNPSSPPTPGTTTPAGTYAVVVRATSGGTQSSTVINLTVQ